MHFAPHFKIDSRSTPPHPHPLLDPPAGVSTEGGRKRREGLSLSIGYNGPSAKSHVLMVACSSGREAEINTGGHHHHHHHHMALYNVKLWVIWELVEPNWCSSAAALAVCKQTNKHTHVLFAAWMNLTLSLWFCSPGEVHRGGDLKHIHWALANVPAVGVYWSPESFSSATWKILWATAFSFIAFVLCLFAQWIFLVKTATFRGKQNFVWML